MEQRVWTTYRMEDGSLIWGDYAWVENPEYFEGVTEPTKVIKETWILKDSKIEIFEPIYWDEEDYEDMEEE